MGADDTEKVAPRPDMDDDWTESSGQTRGLKNGDK